MVVLLSRGLDGSGGEKIRYSAAAIQCTGRRDESRHPAAILQNFLSYTVLRNAGQFMRIYPKSAAILHNNRKVIPGGVVSVNRATQPEIVFERAKGAHVWDVDGNRYIDYHAAFAAHFLGHNDDGVNDAIQRTLMDGKSLYGSGTTVDEGRLAELICQYAPFVDSVQLLNTGSEATYQALRVARAATGRSHIIVMQGGYNGWHNDVACNLMTPLAQLGRRVSPGEYPFIPISAGIPEEHRHLVHVVNFNDLDSVAWVCERYPVAALLTEPILQNIGVVQPVTGYLQGLRKLADQLGFVLIFDEVKTGFRHGLGGYAALAGVYPDLAVYGKAIANGYPISALGGRKDLMDLFVSSDAGKRVLLAGTYNAHPVPTAAAIATITRLAENGGAVYKHVERLGERMELGLRSIGQRVGIPFSVARQGSALCVYFAKDKPVDWHDLASHHDFALDERMRRQAIDQGVYMFPLATKQVSISAAHTEADIEVTLSTLEGSLRAAVEVEDFVEVRG
jgi:glutamate-1-semialdehyde 2,1-aminomutase